MLTYLITLTRQNDGHTYKWLREYLTPWQNAASIVGSDGVDECMTDKRQMPLILVEFFDGVEGPDEQFGQELVTDDGVFDYTVYTDEVDDDEEDEEE